MTPLTIRLNETRHTDQTMPRSLCHAAEAIEARFGSNASEHDVAVALREITCQTCSGAGVVGFPQKITCPVCTGDGWRSRRRRIPAEDNLPGLHGRRVAERPTQTTGPTLADNTDVQDLISTCTTAGKSEGDHSYLDISGKPDEDGDTRFTTYAWNELTKQRSSIWISLVDLKIIRSHIDHILANAAKEETPCTE